MSDDEHIIAFDSFDELLEWQSEQEALANARVLQFQKALRPGMKVGRIVRFGGQPLLILGQTVSAREHYEQMIAKGYQEEECAWERDSITERFTRGYLYGRWYSAIEPDGEYGDAHISTLGPQLPEALWNRLLERIQAGGDPLKETT